MFISIDSAIQQILVTTYYVAGTLEDTTDTLQVN